MTRLCWDKPLLVCMFLIHASESTHLDLWKTSCPFNDFSTTDSLTEYNNTDGDVQPCCSKCSCDEECWVFSNCCPDVAHEKPVDIQTATCTQLTFQNEFTASHSFTIDQYRVLDFCPRDYDVTNQHIIDQCEERISDNTRFTDVVAVSDSKNRIYKNKYCALCHGATDVQMWQVRLGLCKRSMELSSLRLTASQYTRTLLENCYIESIPPNRQILASSDIMLCGKSLSDYCPSTVDKNETFTDIVDGCINGPEMQFLENNFGQNSYYRFKNVFCYLCGHGSVESPGTICPVPSKIPVKTQFTSFNTLLELNRSARINDQAEMGTTQCTEAEFFDSVKNTCIPLHCPVFSVLSFGECLDIGTTFDNYYVYIQIQYEPIQDHLITENIRRYDSQETNAFVGKLLKNAELQMCNPHGFDGYAYVEKFNSRLRYVLIGLRLQIDTRCRLDVIVKAVRNHFTAYNNISMVINSVPVQLTGRIQFYRRNTGDVILYPYSPDPLAPDHNLYILYVLYINR